MDMAIKSKIDAVNKRADILAPVYMFLATVKIRNRKNIAKPTNIVLMSFGNSVTESPRKKAPSKSIDINLFWSL